MELSSIMAMPLGLMTGAQFLTLMSELHRHRQQEAPPVTVSDVSDDRRYAYGISGICEIFGCSKPTAQRIKRSGVIDGAIVQSGRTIVIDRLKALALVKEDNEKKKGGRGCRK